jgi:hypothetical protein
MVSNPLFIIADFFCIFPMNFAMVILDLKEMGNETANSANLFPYLPKGIFPFLSNLK